ncbi:DUF2887 domain-containing protein [Alkalinema pantanalense CENA528]|uniref:DUF2887 domain-containing protein n=1 Tax=Alkalinema pantanalense TaxID=1620705 RepID=UPI003D6DEA66
MKRDSIFYQLFKRSPELLFDLIDPNFPNAERYRFESIEVKETAFRIDGVFLPPEDASPKVVFFGEVQFQKDEELYKRFFAELFVFLRRSEVAYDDWGGVIIFGSRSLEPTQWGWYRSLLLGEQVVRIYLDEIEDWQDQPLAVGLALLTVVSDAEVVDRARVLLERGTVLGQRRDIIEWISTIMVYRFPQLGWEGVEAMFNIQDVRIEDTRAYQEIAEKQGNTVKSSFLLELLTNHLGDLPETVTAQVSMMSPERMSDLGKAMFGLQTVKQLEAWLVENK